MVKTCKSFRRSSVHAGLPPPHVGDHKAIPFPQLSDNLEPGKHEQRGRHKETNMWRRAAVVGSFSPLLSILKRGQDQKDNKHKVFCPPPAARLLHPSSLPARSTRSPRTARGRDCRSKDDEGDLRCFTLPQMCSGLVWRVENGSR